MAALMSITQYEARAGRTFSGVKRTQVEAYLDDASAIVRRIAATRDEDETGLEGVDFTNVPPELLPIIFNMVGRGLHNPHGLLSEDIGDYGYKAPEGQSIYATAEEEKLILAAVDRSIIGHITLEGDMPERLLLQASIAFPLDDPEGM